MREKRFILSKAARARRTETKRIKEEKQLRLYSRLRKQRKKFKKRSSAPS